MSYATKEANNEYSKKYQRGKYQSRKTKALEFLGGKCTKCGCLEGLEFDHIDPHQKSFDITSYLNNRPWNIVQEELVKCQLLCTECHKDKTGRAAHGTISMYRHHRCRCDSCRSVWNGYMREYKARRRGSPQDFISLAAQGSSPSLATN